METAIVSFRSSSVLPDCIESLRTYEPEVTLHVADNASNDGTVEMVRTRFPDVRLTVLDTNAGFGAAVNAVIRKSAADFILVLNPDTRFVEPVVHRLTKVMDEHPDVGICGCRLEQEDGSLDHAARRGFPTPLSAFAYFTGLDRVLPRLSGYTAPDVEQGRVDAVNGAFMLMRARALREVGLFDEGYWMYMEDLDLCYRFRQRGWATWYEPSVRVIHKKGGATVRAGSVRLTYAFHYGMFRFYREHYAPSRPLFVNAAIYLAIAGKLAIALASTPLERAR